jgi:hypothetical protein
MQKFTQKSSTDFYAKIYYRSHSDNTIVENLNKIIEQCTEEYEKYKLIIEKKTNEIKLELISSEKKLEIHLSEKQWKEAYNEIKRLENLITSIQIDKLNIDISNLNNLAKRYGLAKFEDFKGYVQNEIDLEEQRLKIIKEHDTFFKDIAVFCNKSSISLDTSRFIVNKSQLLSLQIGQSQSEFIDLTSTTFKVITYLLQLIDANFQLKGRPQLKIELTQKKQIKFLLVARVDKVSGDFFFTKKELKKELKNNDEITFEIFLNNPKNCNFTVGALKRNFQMN